MDIDMNNYMIVCLEGTDHRTGVMPGGSGTRYCSFTLDLVKSTTVT